MMCSWFSSSGAWNIFVDHRTVDSAQPTGWPDRALWEGGRRRSLGQLFIHFLRWQGQGAKGASYSSGFIFVIGLEVATRTHSHTHAYMRRHTQCVQFAPLCVWFVTKRSNRKLSQWLHHQAIFTTKFKPFSRDSPRPTPSHHTTEMRRDGCLLRWIKGSLSLSQPPPHPLHWMQDALCIQN